MRTWSAVTAGVCPGTHYSLAWHAHEQAHAMAEPTSGLPHTKIMEFPLNSLQEKLTGGMPWQSKGKMVSTPLAPFSQGQQR